MRIFMKHLRIPVLVLNFFIALFCVAAVGGYFAMPFLDIGVSATVTDAEKAFGNIVSDGSDLMNKIDLNETFNGVRVDLSVSLNTLDILSSLTEIGSGSETELPAAITSIIDANVNQITAAVTGQLGNIVETAAPQIIASVVSEQLYTTVSQELQASIPNVTEEETMELLAQVGVDDEYIATVSTEAIQVIYAENASIDSVTEYAVATAKEVCEKLQQSDNEQLSSIEFTPEMEETVRETIDKYAREYGIADEDGSIDMDSFGIDFLLSLLKEGNLSVKVSVLSAVTIASYRTDAEPLPAADDMQTPADSQAELEAEVRNLIYKYIPNDAKEIGYVMIALYIITALILLSMIPWVYLFIKILFKSFMKNPAVKLKAPILFGWLPFLLFMAIPNLAVFLLPMLYPMESLPFVFQISVMSASVIAFLAAVALIIISFGYGSLRKKIEVERIVDDEVRSFNA